MKKLTIKEIGILSSAKVSGALGLVIGLIIGVIYALVFLVVGASMMGSGEEEGAGFLVMGGVFVCAAPLAYGLLSFVMGAVYAFVYNTLVGFTGGLEMVVEETGA